MVAVLWVGLGGFLGSVLRYLVAGWVHRGLNTSWFPYGTFTVNVTGCMVIGFLAGLTETRQVFNPEARLFLFIGVLGGFTTFSTFVYETSALLDDGQIIAASLNIGLQVILGLVAVWLGGFLSRIV